MSVAGALERKAAGQWEVTWWRCQPGGRHTTWITRVRSGHHSVSRKSYIIVRTVPIDKCGAWG